MDIVVKNTKQIEHYQGAHAIPGIRFRPAREAMNVSAWGMNILELDPNCSGYPEHDHTHDGQEEVYLVMEGSVVLVAEGVERVLRQGDLVRVPPTVKRKLLTRQEGVTLLAIGGTPGKAYAPDPRMSAT
jgi:mannose-6-phosphate isomerase-like protein (cupin superfamily)